MIVHAVAYDANGVRGRKTFDINTKYLDTAKAKARKLMKAEHPGAFVRFETHHHTVRFI